MADGPTPRPAGWKGGGEDFGFVRTFDGHIAVDLFESGSTDEGRFGHRNARKGFERADIGGEYETWLDE
jgi:hypothetical protein